ncbi:MAG: STAS/SEC14 domain-containing protein [Bacteroidia bacterium]|nr:STAS/SEC14 domain-containing protein [Bacteroidia bacterium]
MSAQQAMQGDKHITRICEMHMEENRILYARVFDGLDITLADIEETNKAQKELAGNEPFYVLANALDITLGHVDREAFSLNAADKTLTNKKAEAYVLNSLSVKLLVNFYVQFFKPSVPVKIFNDIDEARAWLLEHKKLEEWRNS